MLARYQAPGHHKRIARLQKLQQLVQQKAPSKAGAAAAAAAEEEAEGDEEEQAAAGIEPCVLLAIQARLQQKMLIHVYGLLCDALKAELLSVLREP
jgi:hypothetical protein